MEKTEVVAKIIEYVGGKDNVVNTWHCMTRLRFELKDTSKIQEDAIKALDGVIGVQFAKGQLQIVLGTSVHKYYDIALQMLDLPSRKKRKILFPGSWIWCPAYSAPSCPPLPVPV